MHAAYVCEDYYYAYARTLEFNAFFFSSKSNFAFVIASKNAFELTKKRISLFENIRPLII